MNDFDHTKIDADDPRLTAYALEELEGEDYQRVKAAVDADPALAAAVEEIRAAAGQIADALAAEPLPKAGKPVHIEAYHTVRPARVFRFPYWAVAGLAAAACFALVISLRELTVGPREPEPLFKKSAGKYEVSAKPAPVAPAVRQPPNHIDIQFPKAQDEGNAVADATENQVGVVIPNPPPETEAPKLAGAPVPAGHTEVRTTAGTGSRPPLSAAAPPAAAAAGLMPRSAPEDSGDEVVQLSPFLADADRAQDYKASSTVGGARLGVAAMPNATYGRGDKFPGPGLAQRNVLSRTRAFNTEAYDSIAENDFLVAAENPLSTFAIDVDTASYANVRRFLKSDHRPPRDAVRIEEMLNYFAYGYAAPAAGDPAPFAVSLEVAAAPWEPEHRLVRIGLKGREVSVGERPAANLVFLLDVSGSMDEPGKLPLVQESMKLLLASLKSEDHVAIVTYAGTSGLALPSTPVRRHREIVEAIDALSAGGSTNRAVGIQLAYDIAKANFVPGGINRVILATDGDFNIGMTNRGDLVRLIKEEASRGVFLTVLGFGMGNYKDSTLEELADKGNGAYAYVDTEREARKVMIEQANGTLVTIAKDVKVQVEFNPALVQAYRLIGYENRLLKKEDFNNDKVDAGDIGAGHTVTALYEVVPAGVAWTPEAGVDALKYQKPQGGGGKAEASAELLTVKLRYKAPDSDASRRLEFPLTDRGQAFAAASGDFKFAAAVAGFGMILRDSPHRGKATLGQVLQWAEQGLESDRGGYRLEFITLVKMAEGILPRRG